MPKGNCEFNGTGRQYLELFIIHLFLLSLVTFGIYSPWAWVRLFKLKASHTVINGKQVNFTGTGGTFFVICLVNGLLTIITLGIYSPWAICRILKWKARNTLVDGKPSDFVGTGGGLFILYLVHLILLPMLTLGIYYCYGMYRFYAWKEEHARYGGERTSFGSGFGGLLKLFLVFALIWLIFPVIGQSLNLTSIDLLAPIIFILLAPWLMCMFFSWQINGLAVGDEAGVEHFPPVKTSFLLVVVLILIGLLAVGAVGLFVKDQFVMKMAEMGELTQILDMKLKTAEKNTEATRVPVKRPSRAITPRPGSKSPSKAISQKSAPPPKPGDIQSPEKGGLGKTTPPAPSSPVKVTDTRSEEYEREIKESDALIKKDLQNADTYYSRGCLYALKGDLRNAEKAFTRAIEINNRDSDAYYNRGLVFFRMKKYSLAVKDFDEVIELDPNAVDAYCNRGSANYQLGKNDLAMRDYNKGLIMRPNDADLLYNRSLAYFSKIKSQTDAHFKKAATLRHKSQPRKEVVSKERCNFDDVDINNVPIAPFLDEVTKKIDISENPTYKNMPRGKGNYRSTVDPFYFKRDRGKMPSYSYRQFTTSRDMREIVSWYKGRSSRKTCEEGGAFAQGGGAYSNGPFDNSAANFGVNNGRNFIVVTAMKAPGDEKTTVYLFHYRKAPPP